ncbi:MAG: polyphosphate kinase 2, partial [Gammaproteobacteria bacterium]|nr:polyphosphate kinase 2 [Gammaproteobacteria bacterium]
MKTNRDISVDQSEAEEIRPNQDESVDHHSATAAHLFSEMRHDPEQIRDLFREGKYPYKNRIKKQAYETHKKELQAELLKVQNWVKQTGQRIVVIFEGRDAAGKGG